MDIAALKTELTDDPLSRGYSGLSDVEAADSLNTVNRTSNRTSMTGSEVLNAIDKVKYNALSDVDKDRVWQVLHLGELNPFGIEADLMQDIFGASTTITALQAARLEAVSRATEIGLGIIFEGTVQQARAM